MHGTFLKSLKLLAKAKERANTSSGTAGFERQMTAASRGRGVSWNGPQRTNFKGQPVEGQRGRPMKRSQPSRPIEDKCCYECGILGHLSYDCPKRQVQGKFTNVTRSNQPSYDEPGEGSSDESNVGEFSERGYEKDEYEVDVQAFMARGQGERQERVEAREARRRREEETASAQPSAPVRPSVERAAQPRQARRKPVLEAQWQKYVRESWTIPIGMLAGRSRREVYGQAMLALRDALGRQQTRAQMGYLGPYRLKKALIDLGSTRMLVSEEFINKHSIPMQRGSIPVQVGTNEIALEEEQGESEFPRDEDWATTSSGSTHTNDYTWMERTNDRSSGEDSVSSGGSAHSAKYTEEGEVSRTGPMLRGNIPALHA